MADVQTIIERPSTTMDIITVVAILLGPILAIQAQKIMEKLQEKKSRRLGIFKTLMSTRATPLDAQRVRALNLIDIEFEGSNKEDKSILSQWKICLDHLNSGPSDPAASEYQADLKIWAEKLNELNGSLLQKIGNSLGYDFDEIQIKKGAYSPQAHVNIEQEQQTLRTELIGVLSGKKALLVNFDRDVSED